METPSPGCMMGTKCLRVDREEFSCQDMVNCQGKLREACLGLWQYVMTPGEVL